MQSDKDKQTYSDSSGQEKYPEPSPWEEARSLIRKAEKTKSIKVKPTIPFAPWSLGLAIEKGFVRDENQDCGIAFQINECDVLITADGCGGHPYGDLAAQLAVRRAAWYIVRACGSTGINDSLESIASAALEDASRKLISEGGKLNISDISGGLRTTLIVLVADENEAGYAYIGDGGGYVLRPSGEVFEFLKPQKAEGLPDHCLAATLGPTKHGEAVSGSFKRAKGDFIAIGSDGVFDRTGPSFMKDLLGYCLRNQGDLQKSAEQMLQEMALIQDDLGYICDDNMTLGIMCRGCPPELPEDFWVG